MALSTIGTNQISNEVFQANRNLIINGEMSVAQRGTSSTTNGYGSVDRWKLTYGGGGTLTHSQQSLTSGSPYQEGFRSSFRATVTSASNAAGTYAQLEQRIEAQNMAQSGWEYTSTSSSLTLSFWAKSSLAGTYYVQFRTVDTTEYYYNKSFTLSADTWKKITCTVAGNSNLVINNDNGSGFSVLVVPDYGTTYTGDAEAVTDAWYARTQTDGYFPNFAQDWHNTGSATFEITAVQLEVGEVATPFEHEDIGTTLRKCQRYYVRMNADAAYSMWGAGFAYTSTATKINIPFPVEMRTAPSLGQSANNTLDIFTGGDSPAFTSDAVINNPSSWGTNLTCTVGSITVGYGCVIMANNSTAAYLEFMAEL